MAVTWASSKEGDDAEVVERTLDAARDFDAMVLISGVFSHNVNGLWRFAQKWSPRPVVSLGYKLPAVASLMMDNRSAVRRAASHLIEEHGRRSLLFVKGRKDSHESEERYLGYRHALRDHGLLSDERLVIEGGFTRRGTIRALQNLDPSVKFDGVLAANDDMALAMIEKLIRQGLRVPEDVAVIGFDDIPEARKASIPLSTIVQPFAEMARLALDSLCSQAEAPSRQQPAVQAVSGPLSLRASCCGSHR